MNNIIANRSSVLDEIFKTFPNQTVDCMKYNRGCRTDSLKNQPDFLHLIAFLNGGFSGVWKPLDPRKNVSQVDNGWRTVSFNDSSTIQSKSIISTINAFKEFVGFCELQFQKVEKQEEQKDIPKTSILQPNEQPIPSPMKINGNHNPAVDGALDRVVIVLKISEEKLDPEQKDLLKKLDLFVTGFLNEYFGLVSLGRAVR